MNRTLNTLALLAATAAALTLGAAPATSVEPANTPPGAAPARVITPTPVSASGAPGTVVTAKFRVVVAAQYKDVSFAGGNSDNGRYRYMCSNIRKLPNGKTRLTCAAKFRVPVALAPGRAVYRPIFLSWLWGPETPNRKNEVVTFNARISAA